MAQRPTDRRSRARNRARPLPRRGEAPQRPAGKRDPARTLGPTERHSRPLGGLGQVLGALRRHTPPPRPRSLDRRSRPAGPDPLPDGNSCWADRVAGPAIQAIVGMGPGGFLEEQPALFRRPEEGQAPPRRLRLLAGRLIRGAPREATGTPDAGQPAAWVRPDPPMDWREWPRLKATESELCFRSAASDWIRTEQTAHTMFASGGLWPNLRTGGERTEWPIRSRISSWLTPENQLSCVAYTGSWEPRT